ncbi:MAG: outer membrane protein assembly factor BamD [Ignavibacteriales bacterium]|jgi:outer membrane protein assembly factor BamD|nr:outer membrane protein assembly factor BamD [Ignavibacteriaceae bacterium]NLH61286.1 outer membrane protein assembly factor BamD [Ignavibacteriales bacterium]HOJ19012.1 outer membrane protein assembly factor BamD [Ignavibacteriaceae bacterium]HPO54597.1 outer membrane protein assembly factor BamD [Ignavibacteriaceae bacterium]
MKKTYWIILFSLIIAGCSATVDTANMQPQDRLNYAIKLYEEESYEQAVIEFEAIMLQYPGSEFVDKAQYYLAMTRFKRSEYIIAASEFSRLIRNMPSSVHVPDAQFMLADCYFTLSPKFALDQRYTKQAIQEFQSFIDFFPTDSRVAQAEEKISFLNSKLAEKEFNSAYIYEKLDYYNAALLYYDNVLSFYHDTQFAPKASYNKIYILIEKERTLDALTEANNFLLKYPQDSNYSNILKIKETLENKLKTSEN